MRSRPGPALLPSDGRRRALAASVRNSLAGVPDDRLDAMQAVLGDLGLWLAHRPLARWTFTPAELAAELDTEWTPGELEAALDEAYRGGLLAEAGEERLYPPAPEELAWLAARRTLRTEDEPGHLNHRLRGALADVFALVVAEQDDPDRGRGLSALLAEREGPFEDLLELSARLVASAAAWGGAVDAETRARLLSRAVAWTDGSHSEDLEDAGAALLAAELTGRHAGELSFAAEVRDGLLERLGLLVEQLGELPESPELLRCLDATLAPLVAEAGTNAGRLEALGERLGPHASRAGWALARVRPPGPRTDELLVAVTQQAAAAGCPDAPALLGLLQAPEAAPPGLLEDALAAALAAPVDAGPAAPARAACEALAAWRRCPEHAGELLVQAVAGHADPELRSAAAAAIAACPALLEVAGPVLHEMLGEELQDEDPLARTGAVGAALWLGTDELSVPAIAVGLVVDGAPVDVLSPALAHALRVQPGLADAFETLWERFPQPELRTGTVHALQALVTAAQADHELGPYLPVPPLSRYVRTKLTILLLDLVNDWTEPERAGHAAVIAGWLSRGQRGLAETVFGLREQAPDDATRGIFDLALGACGVPAAGVQDLLARDAAAGEPELAECAGAALCALLDVATEMVDEALDPHVAAIRARIDVEGPHQAPLRAALHALATLPTGL